ncbi:hypothetical protein [Mesorhizobium sp. IMUNJ 23232]|uniref:hypothetical protein n=1 Tax=Mesorhizobium sp. IMUNJ 23232 TaxID=3376064 RepID=UPI00379A6EDB
MPHLRIFNDRAGYDEDRYTLVMSVKRKPTIFHLVAGPGLEVKTDEKDGKSVVEVFTEAGDDAAVHKDGRLSGWEKEQTIRKITLTAKEAGSTVLRAVGGGADQIKPLPITVVSNNECRQVGNALGEITTKLREDVQKLSLRDAVIEVARDQMNSAISIGHSKNGFGVYMKSETLNWCGAFAYWCWAQAAFIKGESNPFANGGDEVLWSPQRAIEWAYKPSSPVNMWRVDAKNEGYDPTKLARADIVLVRANTSEWKGEDESKRPSGPWYWKHVCMVYSISGDTIMTMDGNQGWPQAIKIVQRSLSEKVDGGPYKLAFVHPFMV